MIVQKLNHFSQKLKQKLKTQGQKLKNFQKLNYSEILFAADAGKSAKK